MSSWKKIYFLPKPGGAFIQEGTSIRIKTVFKIGANTIAKLLPSESLVATGTPLNILNIVSP